MARTYRTPGVYIEEVSKLPPSVVAVETAIPAFIGFTERTRSRGEDLLNRPVRIGSLLEFEALFGQAKPIGEFTVSIDADGQVLEGIADPWEGPHARFRLAYAMRHFYDNGGGPCYVVSIGDYQASTSHSETVNAHLAGLTALSREDEPTLIVLPDLSGMQANEPADVPAARASYHQVLVQALNQCAALGDRFLICDVWDGDAGGSEGIEAFRNGIGTRNLKYGAVYHPFVVTTLPWRWDEGSILLSQLARRKDDGSLDRVNTYTGQSLSALRGVATRVYENVRKELERFTVILPPAAAVAGIYATNDRTRGVWKAPANESLASVRRLTVDIDVELNDEMNLHSTGKSINALRFFAGKGYLVWGARTLAGNDNEWRYISVRRFFNMVEESTKKATEPFVFEPNDANTWAKVRAMIENFLVLQWRQGALVGAKPDDAFFVRVGLGTTMTAQDILEGRMHVEIGMAVVRPAEFIVLSFSHKMQEA